MTITHRKRQHQPDEILSINEPGVQIECDACSCNLTHSIRIKCADSVCETGDGVDICPACFCSGKEFGKHRRSHPYRVVELHSYPIFSEDWGADEELLLIEGISLQGLGNWLAIADHVGTRTKEEIEQHYTRVYVDSPEWPLPNMDVSFDIDPSEFQESKRRRILALNSTPVPPPKAPPTSAPGVHEISTFLPGRLEFEHELDNEAEDLVKDLEFGVCLEWGGADLPEDDCGTAADGEINADEATLPLPVETPESLQVKLTLVEMYLQRVEKRREAKAIIFDRGLLEYKKMQIAEKKRPKDEKDVLHRLRCFARLQTAVDYETFSADILYESLLRKRIQELQHYRRMGLTTVADVDKYEQDCVKRAQAKANLSREYHATERFHLRTPGGRGSSGPDPRRVPTGGGESDSRRSDERETTPKLSSLSTPNTVVRKPPQPLNLANSPSLHLLTPAEQTLCSQLRILPKPYLVIKETLVREYARRGGKLRRREARDLVKIDVNKTSRVWDFLVQAGFLRIAPEPAAPSSSAINVQGESSVSSLNSSPVKDTSRPVVPPVPTSNGIPLASASASLPMASVPSWTSV